MRLQHIARVVPEKRAASFFNFSQVLSFIFAILAIFIVAASSVQYCCVTLFTDDDDVVAAVVVTGCF